MNIFSIEGIPGSGKSTLINKLSERFSVKQYKVFTHSSKHSFIEDIMLARINDTVNSCDIKVMEHLIFIKKLHEEQLNKNIIVLMNQYVLGLYVRLKNDGYNTSITKVFDEYPSKVVFYLDCDFEEAFESCNNQRSISYWETNLHKMIDKKDIIKDVLQFYRGKYSPSQIRYSFIEYYQSYTQYLMENIVDYKYIKIDKSYSMDEKVDQAYHTILDNV